MSDETPKVVDIEGWVKEAKSDPVKYRTRQVTEVVLAAIGLSEELKSTLYLKGGALMSISHSSPRSTTDLDLTAVQDPLPFADQLVDLLDTNMRSAAKKLGYIDLMCKVQSVKKRPRESTFDSAENPAVSLKIGSAIRGTREAANLERNNATQTLEIDVTFKEPVETCEILALDGTELTVHAYGLLDLMAEKLRSLLQQPVRNRNRRQDVFDIHLLLNRYGPFDGNVKSALLAVLKEKASARALPISHNSFSDPRIAQMAQAEWQTLQAELSIPLPDFITLFSEVKLFYESLPWTDVS